MIFIPDNPIARLLEAPPHQRMALRAIMRGRNLNQSQIDRFLKHGVEAINLFKAWSTQADCVTFNGEYFEFADDNDVSGVQVFTMGVIGEIGLIDVLAWHPSSGRLATWLGLGFGLGEAEINHHVDNDSAGLAVFRTPLNWLRAGCEGIVIVHKAFANIALANVRRLIAEDENHRKELLGMFPFGGPRILVRDPKDPNSGVELEVAA
jgi:hypothetical protein